jgi:myo-inositol catabolism protein IolS
MSQNKKLVIGTEQLGGEDWGNLDLNLVSESIKYALDNGIKSFDTAHVYGLGLSEKRLSNLLGEKRHECEIITKVGLSWDIQEASSRAIIKKDLSYSSMRSSVESSLKNLRIDCIPILFAHWPDNKHTIQNVIESLYLIRDAGLVNKIGLSNFDLNEVINIQKFTPIDFYQGSLSLLDQSKVDLYRRISSMGIGILTYGPLHHGLLTGKYNEDSIFLNSDRRHRMEGFSGIKSRNNYKKVEIVKEYARNLKCNLTQLSIIILYHLGIDLRVIVGVKNIKQLQQNISSLSVDVPGEFIESLLQDINEIDI